MKVGPVVVFNRWGYSVSLVGIGLTEQPNIGGPVDPRVPRFRHHSIIITMSKLSFRLESVLAFSQDQREIEVNNKVEATSILRSL